eukprot:829247-Prorocentrum_minimum.AAC.3
MPLGCRFCMGVVGMCDGNAWGIAGLSGKLSQVPRMCGYLGQDGGSHLLSVHSPRHARRTLLLKLTKPDGAFLPEARCLMNTSSFCVDTCGVFCGCGGALSVRK